MDTKQLKRIQIVTGILFSIFLCLHLLNTALAIAGPSTYNNTQQVLQAFYQTPIVELFLIVIPLSIHALIGLNFLINRRKLKLDPKQRLHSYAGIFLLIFIFGHIAATRGIALLANADPGFAGVSFTLKWMPLYFYPYYFLLFFVGLYHAYNGIMKSILILGFNQGARIMLQIQRYVLSIGALTGLLALLSFGGILADTPEISKNNYVKYYAKVFGLDLKEYE